MTNGGRTLYTLAVGGYPRAITDLTFPLMQRWARKVGADFRVIDSRAFPQHPITCEKFQLAGLALARHDEWSMFLDADALIHPNTPDLFEHLRKDTVYHMGWDIASCRYDTRLPYFRRDGRDGSPGNWLTIASDWCRDDLWRLLPAEEMPALLEGITPSVSEMAANVTRENLSDDYIIAINEARYGLKVGKLQELLPQLGLHPGACFWHDYMSGDADKVAAMRKLLDEDWKVALR